MLTPDSESVLDRLDRLEREATPVPWNRGSYAQVPRVFWGRGNGTTPLVTLHDMASVGDAKLNAALIALSRNHLRALLDVARAAQAHYDEWASINAFEHLPLPIQAIGQALAPLTPPSEQNLQTESESRGVAPPYKGVEERSA